MSPPFAKSGVEAQGFPKIIMYYTYLLRSVKDNGFYIGSTEDLKRRFEQHIRGRVESTKNRRPLELFYYEAYNNIELARDREKKLKQFGSSYVCLLKRLKIK